MHFFERDRSPTESYLLKEMNQNINYPRHMHSTFELIDVMDGEIVLTLSDSNEEFIIDKSKAALILPYQVHAYRTERYSKYILAIFSSDYVRTFYDMVKDKAAGSPLFDFSDFALSQSLLETEEVLMESSYLYAICASYYRQQTFTEQPHINVNLISKIIEYVEQHYTEDISLRSIAEAYNYSYHYLSNFFNSNIGIHFKRFLNEYRIHHACMLLRDSKCSITDIALQSGYDTLRSFNREFLSIMGYTPSQYKRRITQEKSESPIDFEVDSIE